jgi:hypothetical protein
VRPKWLLTHPTGDLMIKKVLDASNYKEFDRVVITILRDHCDDHAADTILHQIFGTAVDILILEEPTSSSAETVYLTIKRAGITGQIIIKDSDCIVKSDSAYAKNSIVGMEIDSISDVERVQTKSFIVKNDDDIILDIIEKEIVSNIICLGVYSVSAEDFVSAFEEVRDSLTYKLSSEIYVSHIISYLILEKQKIFNYVKSTRFVDWGTAGDWASERAKFKTYIFDIDGVLLKNYGKYGAKNWSNTFEPIENNIRTLKDISDAGHQIIFMTSRPEEYLGQFRSYLQSKNIKYKEIITSCFHGQRIIINDFANTNPWPSCSAISIRRNDKLQDYIP